MSATIEKAPMDILQRRELTHEELEEKIRGRWNEDPNCKRCGLPIPRPEVADLVYTDESKTTTDLIHSSCLRRSIV